MAHRSVSASRLVSLLGSTTNTTPAYRGLADGVRLLIADGQVPAGTRLPSERELTSALAVSRTTVTRAYEALRDLGYATSRQGSGTVAALPAPAGRRHRAPLMPGDSGEGDTINLTCASMPAPPGTAAAYEAAVRAMPGYLDGTGYHPIGLPSLRETIAQRYTDRGLPTSPDQVMVTAGALAGLAIVGRTLLSNGDRVLLESPTYPNAIEAVRRAGARGVGLAMDGQGWDTESMEATLRQTAPRAAYLMPDFHNPTGALMDNEQRAQIGEALTRTHTAAVVDETLVDVPTDPDAEHPLPFASFAERTITLGSSSKAYWGGVRTGWLRAPLDLLPSLTEARLTLDLGAPVLEQLVLVELLARRETIVRERSAALAESRGALAKALREQLPEWDFTLPRGGLSLWIRLPAPVSTALTVSAERHGVLLAPGPQFAVEGGLERWIRIPFSHPAEVLTEAVSRIAAAYAEVGSASPAGPQSRSPLVA